MGLSNIEVKKVNRNNILRYLLSSGAVSKNNIAEQLHLSVPTIAQGLNELQELGLVREDGILDSIGGRKAKSYCSVKDAKYALGLDITENHLNIVVLNLAKELVFSERVKMKLYDTEDSYKKLKMVIEEVIEKSSINQDKILGLGISLPAIIDEDGKTIYAMHEKMHLSCRLYDIVKEWFHFPIVIGNDANYGGKAEIEVNGVSGNTIYFFISQSVGGAVIVDGKLCLGRTCRSGEFGHMMLVPGGRKCYCGRRGCTNSYLSVKLLSGRTNGNLGAFFASLEEGNEENQAVWEEYLDYLARAVHNLNAAFDWEIIIGGYLGQFIGPYIEQLRERVQKLNPGMTDMSFIKSGVLRYEASATGAAEIFIENFISEI